MRTSPTCAEDCVIELCWAIYSDLFVGCLQQTKQKSFFFGRKGKPGRDTVVHVTNFNGFWKNDSIFCIVMITMITRRVNIHLSNLGKNDISARLCEQ